MAKKLNLKPDILVCALLNDPTHHVRGSVRGHFCSRCSSEVVIARSGQRILRAWPKLPVFCLPCGMKEAQKPDAIFAAAPGAMRELMEDLAQDAVEARTKHRRN